jgi:hypothetical protein
VSNVRESHFFKSGKEDDYGPGVNYYRVRVTAQTLMSSSRYVSGYFDPDALDVYFNEIHQPADAALRPKEASDKPPDPAKDRAPTETKSAAPTARPVAPSLVGKDLVLILSTNSDDVSNQIGALAANQQFTASLAGLAAQKDFADAAAAENRLHVTKARARNLATLSTQAIGALADTAGTTEAQTAVVLVLNRLAYDMGLGVSFSSLAEWGTWFEKNRNRVYEGGAR